MREVYNGGCTQGVREVCTTVGVPRVCMREERYEARSILRLWREKRDMRRVLSPVFGIKLGMRRVLSSVFGRKRPLRVHASPLPRGWYLHAAQCSLPSPVGERHAAQCNLPAPVGRGEEERREGGVPHHTHHAGREDKQYLVR